MKRFFFALAVLAISHYVHAQTSTANAGLHEAESAPEFAFTGTGWVQFVDGDYIVMESSLLGDSVSLEFNGSSAIIVRELLLLADTPAQVEICLDSLCALYGSEAGEYQRRVPIAFFVDGASPHLLTITNTDGGIFRLDAVMVMPEDELAASESLSPAYRFFTLESGQVVAVDFSISGGDVAQIIFLAFIAGLIAYLIVIQRTKSNE